MSIEVTCDEFSSPGAPSAIDRQLAVPAGASFSVALCSNPTTGFVWSSATIADETIIRQTAHRYEPPSSGRPGAAGREVWTFSALKPGTTVVSMEYRRPWEGSRKATWTFSLAVSVA